MNSDHSTVEQNKVECSSQTENIPVVSENNVPVSVQTNTIPVINMVRDKSDVMIVTDYI